MGAKCEDRVAEFFVQGEIWRSMVLAEEIVKSLDFGEELHIRGRSCPRNYYLSVRRRPPGSLLERVWVFGSTNFEADRHGGRSPIRIVAALSESRKVHSKECPRPSHKWTLFQKRNREDSSFIAKTIPFVTWIV